jgi:hypothetical protein
MTLAYNDAITYVLILQEPLHYPEERTMKFHLGTKPFVNAKKMDWQKK